MKYFFICFFTLTSICSYSQEYKKVFYFDKYGRYSILLNKPTLIKLDTVSVDLGITTFIAYKNDSITFKYGLTINSLPNIFNFQLKSDFIPDKYVDDFPSECSCEVIDKKYKKFNNFNSVEFTYHMRNEKLKGFYNMIVVAETIYIVSFLAKEDEYKLFIDEYLEIMNRLVFVE